MKRRRLITLGSMGLGLGIACSGKLLPAPGEVMLSVTSDLDPTKDYDAIRVQVSSNGQIRHDIAYPTQGGEAIKLPATLAVVAAGNARGPVHVTVTAVRASQPLIVREAVFVVPESGVELLRMPLQYVCSNQLCTDPDTTCKNGTCASDHEETLSRYTPADVFGGGTGHGDGACFDTLACFADATDEAPSMDATSGSCTVALPAGASAAPLNVAVVNPPNGAGICAGDACFVPLDGSAWSVEGSAVVLPSVLCASSHTIALSTACATESPSNPPCGAWSSVGSGGGGDASTGSGGASGTDGGAGAGGTGAGGTGAGGTGAGGTGAGGTGAGGTGAGGTGAGGAGAGGAGAGGAAGGSGAGGVAGGDGGGAGGGGGSCDPGTTWTLLDQGLPHDTSESVAVSPNTPGLAFAAPYSGNLFRSTDYGAHWTPVLRALSGTTDLGQMRDIAIVPKTPNVIYVAAAEVVRSRDGGLTWDPPRSVCGSPSALAFDPQNLDTVYVYCESDNVLSKSTDAGETFQNIPTTGLGIQPLDNVRPVVVGSQLYAAVTGPYHHGVYQFQSASWASIAFNLPIDAGQTEPNVVGVVAGDPKFDVLYAAIAGHGVYSLLNGVWSGSCPGTGGAFPSALTSGTDASGARVLYASFGNGIARGEASPTQVCWSMVSPGISATTMGVDGKGFILTQNARSSDDGKSWSSDLTGYPSDYVFAVAADGTGEVYAGMTKQVYQWDRVVRSWSSLPGKITGQPSSIVTGPGGQLWVSTVNLGAQGYVFYSRDGGQTFTQILLSSSDRVAKLAVDFSKTPAHLYAVTPRTGIVRSTDGGQSWAPSSQGITGLENPQTGQRISFGLAIDPKNPLTVYFGNGGGTFKSTNGGTSWTSINHQIGAEPVNAIAVDPSSGAVYAASPLNLWKSTNGGTSWLTIGPRSSSTIRILPLSSALWTMRSRQVSCDVTTAVDRGFLAPFLNDLAADSGFLYLATQGGVYSLALSAN